MGFRGAPEPMSSLFLMQCIAVKHWYSPFEYRDLMCIPTFWKMVVLTIWIIHSKYKSKQDKSSLTSAVGEAIVTRGTLCALSTNDVLPAGTLSSNRITCGPRGTRFVTVARQSTNIICCYEWAGRVSAELWRSSGAKETEKYTWFYINYHS